MKLARAVFKYVEHELYNYDLTKKIIDELREDIILSTPYKEAVGSTKAGVSDATAKKAVKLVSSVTLARMTRTVMAIDRALARLTDDHRQLFELKYRQALPWQRVCDEMPTSERTYFRLRRELVLMVAVELGLAESWQE